MCTSTSASILENIILGKIRRKESFTAYEVTLAARNEGMTERHNDVRRDVHSIMERLMLACGYSRTTVKISDDIGYARKYYPDTVDPNAAVPAVVPQTISVTIAPSNPTPSSSVRPRLNFPGYDYRGRLSVSTEYVRKAGYFVGDMVGVIVETDKITIQPDSTIGYPYRVSTDNNLRIASTRMKDAFGGFPSDLKYSVDPSMKTIIINK